MHSASHSNAQMTAVSVFFNRGAQVSAETDRNCLGRNSFTTESRIDNWIIAQGSLSNANICGRFRCSIKFEKHSCSLHSSKAHRSKIRARSHMSMPIVVGMATCKVQTSVYFDAVMCQHVISVCFAWCKTVSISGTDCSSSCFTSIHVKEILR